MNHQRDKSELALSREYKLRAITEVTTPSLCPEISLHLAPSGATLEEFRSNNEKLLGMVPPYWAIAWPGGQAIARFLIDHIQLIAGKHVLDFGTGCGIAAIAAAKAGACTVKAIDRDPNATEIARINAILNGVSIECITEDIARIAAYQTDVILAGDLWYERFDAQRITPLLRNFARSGIEVFLGDPNRTYFPHTKVELLQTYKVSVRKELEPSQQIEGKVFRLQL